MKLVLLDTDKFCKVNNLKAVTNPITLDRGCVPTSDGLLSTYIFGTSTHDRKISFAYIDLNCHVLHPILYKYIKRMDSRIEGIVSGRLKVKIDSKGHLITDEENGHTGLDWLYDNWNKIKWPRNESRMRNETIDLLEAYTRNEIFMSKQIVCPAFYRDINLQSSKSGRPSIHKINIPYSKLISLAQSLNNGDFAFNLHYTRFMIQRTCIEIYDYFKNRLEKKRGIIKQNVLGKSTDYGCRIVITHAEFTADRVEDMPIDFYHAGVPVSYCMAMCTPFFTGWIQNFFVRWVEEAGGKFPMYDSKKKEVIYVEVEDPLVQFSDEYIHELMEEYLHSYGKRFEPIKLKTKDPNHKEIRLRFLGFDHLVQEVDLAHPPEDMALVKRDFTITDLMYMAAVDITKNLHIYITRYPMADHLGIFPIGISVLSTTETIPLWVDGKYYPHYPKIEIGKDPSNSFKEVITMQSTMLSAIGGDYDGERLPVMRAIA